MLEKVLDSLSAHQDRITAEEMQLIAVDISLSEVGELAAIFKISSGFGTSGGAGWGLMGLIF